MNFSIFLDTPVFFHCIEHDRLGTILIDINEDWVTDNRYLNMAEFLDKQIFDTESKYCSSAESTVVSIADY